MSVLHMALKRQEGRHENLSVKNKDEMLFYVGFRKFRARPIFSQHTTGNFVLDLYLKYDLSFR